MILETLPNNSLFPVFSSLKAKLFTGKLIIGSDGQQKWSIYWYQGRIIYANGGGHHVRRWFRNVSQYCIAADQPQLDILKYCTDISILQESEIVRAWEYFLLIHWINEKKISNKQAADLIQASAIEIFFDIYQAQDLTWEEVAEPELNPQIIFFDAEKMCLAGYQRWEGWQATGLEEVIPNDAPVITKPEVLQLGMSQTAYVALENSLDGQRSLRELSVLMRRSEQQVAMSLLIFAKKTCLEFVKVPDRPSPLEQYLKNNFLNTAQTAALPLVACVDDSTFVCERMAEIFNSAGFPFFSITDSLRAVPTILARKPALIFLDLVMPNTNGYEICSYIRKVASFKETPIIILTGNDGIVDRVRAKMVGATDFISKPVDESIVLQTAQGYLQLHAQN